MKPTPTVHLVYPHGSNTSTPDAIGRELGVRLERHYRIRYYDWDARARIRPDVGDVLLGHPHPLAGTCFRRSMHSDRWGRVIVLCPFVPVVDSVGWLDGTVRRCDEYLAITGAHWFALLDTSVMSHWSPRVTQLNLAVDRVQFPFIKRSFNPAGRRRFLYIGNTAMTKNTAYLSVLARLMPDVQFSWIGSGDRAIDGVTSLGCRQFETAAATDLVAGYDFLLTVGRADANPTTILESMAWGLIPVCTPQSGYEGYASIPNVPLDDTRTAIRVLRGLQQESESRLRNMQSINIQLLDEYFNWDRFASEVTDAIERTDRPTLPRESMATRLSMASYAFTSPYSPYLPGFMRRIIANRAEESYREGWQL